MLVAVVGIEAGSLGRVELLLVAAMAGAAGFNTGGSIGGTVALVVKSGMWARAELPGVTPIAAVAAAVVGALAVCMYGNGGQV